MTSNVRIKSNNFPVRVETYDNGALVSSDLVLVGDDIERDWYITTTREVRFIDLASDAPEVLAEIEKRKPITEPVDETVVEPDPQP